MSPGRDRLLRAARFAAMTQGPNPHLDGVGSTFMRGYVLALERRPEELAASLRVEFEPFWLAYAWEGAGMAMAMLELDGETGLETLLADASETEGTLACVGAGMGTARSRRPAFEPLPSVLAWTPTRIWQLLLDGRGFHAGKFESWRLLGRRRVTPPKATPAVESEAATAGLAAFDRGLGRSLLFVYGGAVEPLCKAIAGFELTPGASPRNRQDSLWEGVGVACAFTGGVDAADLAQLVQRSGESAAQFGLGVQTGVALRESVSGPNAWTAQAVAAIDR